MQKRIKAKLACTAKKGKGDDMNWLRRFFPRKWLPTKLHETPEQLTQRFMGGQFMWPTDITVQDADEIAILLDD